MGRPVSKEEVLRPEVRLPKNHPATRRLQREARDRDVSLAQHIHDLLLAREAALNDQDYNQLLWVPSVPAAPAQPPASDPPQETRAAASAASAWLKRRNGRSDP